MKQANSRKVLPSHDKAARVLVCLSITLAPVLWMRPASAQPTPSAPSAQPAGAQDTAAQAQTAAPELQASHKPRNDYPTAARADYVIGCMAANGFRRELLDRCACGIDTIANLMSYDDYEKASTIMSMQEAGVGPRGGLFRDTPVAKEESQRLERAEAEVNLRCGG